MRNGFTGSLGPLQRNEYHHLVHTSSVLMPLFACAGKALAGWQADATEAGEAHGGRL